MNHRLINVTQAEIDLLAEDELREDQRRDLFNRLDQHPTQWRQCAFSILETQALRRSITSSLNESLVNQTVLVNGNNSADKLPPAGSPTNGAPIVDRSWPLTSIAAVLLVGIFLGLVIGKSENLFSAQESSNPSITKEKQPLVNASKLAFNRLNISDDQVLAFVHLKQGNTSNVVPVVDSPKLAEQALGLEMSPLTNEQIRQANRFGWNVSQERILVTKEISAEQMEIVPVQMVRYQYVGENVL